MVQCLGALGYESGAGEGLFRKFVNQCLAMCDAQWVVYIAHVAHMLNGLILVDQFVRKNGLLHLPWLNGEGLNELRGVNEEERKNLMVFVSLIVERVSWHKAVYKNTSMDS